MMNDDDDLSSRFMIKSALGPSPHSPLAKLDSDKFGDEAARPNRWLD